MDRRTDISARPVSAIIAGGGTGGHLFPGIAIAESLQDLAPGCRVLFVGTGSAIEARVLPRTGFSHEAIASEGIKGRGAMARVRALAKLVAGIFTAGRLIRRFSPDVVIGMGGYVSAPVVIAARLLGRKVVLCEQNALPGLTNRVLARFADLVCVSHDAAAGRISAGRTLTTGNPVRKDFLKAMGDARPAPDDGQKKFTVFIVGGSQGAHGINVAVTESLAHLKNRKSFRFVHQTGEADVKMVEAAYKRAGVESQARVFFDDMAARYLDADLVVCRAGATTVAEITCMGKACIFVPFPGAADDHQAFNAEALVADGAAEMILQKDLTGEKLAGRINFYAASPDALSAMAERSRRLGKPDAGRRVAQACLSVVSGGRTQKDWVYQCI
ncbi:MAG: undecaprenyldiphospho-muramoylpentapeptide beta-N-acetylglucosaminyltransferase [Thermodesulfobacteriota bacterium]